MAHVAFEGRRRLAAWLGVAAGCAFVLVMAAGADKPPPPGFLLIVVFAILMGAAIARGLPQMLNVWDTRGSRPALLRAGIWGFLGGEATFAVLTAFSTGEPSVQAGAAARLVGIGIVGAFGAVATIAITALGHLLDRRRQIS